MESCCDLLSHCGGSNSVLLSSVGDDGGLSGSMEKADQMSKKGGEGVSLDDGSCLNSLGYWWRG